MVVTYTGGRDCHWHVESRRKVHEARNVGVDRFDMGLLMFDRRLMGFHIHYVCVLIKWFKV